MNEQTQETAQGMVDSSVDQADSNIPASSASEYKGNWGKWLLTYLIIGGVLYAIVWYFFLRGGSTLGY